MTSRWANERFRQVMLLIRQFRMEWPNQTLLTADDTEFIRTAIDVALSTAGHEAHTGDIYDLNPTTWAIWMVQYVYAVRKGSWTAESAQAQHMLSFETSVRLATSPARTRRAVLHLRAGNQDHSPSLQAPFQADGSTTEAERAFQVEEGSEAPERLDGSGRLRSDRRRNWELAAAYAGRPSAAAVATRSPTRCNVGTCGEPGTRSALDKRRGRGRGRGSDSHGGSVGDGGLARQRPCSQGDDQRGGRRLCSGAGGRARKPAGCCRASGAGVAVGLFIAGVAVTLSGAGGSVGLSTRIVVGVRARAAAQHRSEPAGARRAGPRFGAAGAPAPAKPGLRRKEGAPCSWPADAKVDHRAAGEELWRAGGRRGRL